MAKKKTYQPPKDSDWDEVETKEHRRIIAEKEKSITKKYKRWWDNKKGRWKEGFNGHSFVE